MNQYESIIDAVSEGTYNVVESNKDESGRLVFNSESKMYETKIRDGKLADILPENVLLTRLQTFGTTNGCEISHQEVIKQFVCFSDVRELFSYYELSDKQTTKFRKILSDYYNSYELSFGDSFLRSYQYSTQELWQVVLPYLSRKSAQSYSKLSAKKLESLTNRETAKNQAYHELMNSLSKTAAA